MAGQLPVVPWPRAGAGEAEVAAWIDGLAAAVTAAIRPGPWPRAVAHEWLDDGREWREVHVVTATHGDGLHLSIGHTFGGDLRGGGGSVAISVHAGDGVVLLATHEADAWRVHEATPELLLALQRACA